MRLTPLALAMGLLGLVAQTLSREMPMSSTGRLGRVYQAVQSEVREESSLETRLQLFFREHRLVAFQMVSTLFAYAAVAITGLVKMPADTITTARIHSGLAMGCSHWVAFFHQMQICVTSPDILKDPQLVQQLLSAIVSSRSCEQVLLALLSVALSGDQYSTFALLTREFPNLLRLTLLGVLVVTPSVEFSPRVIEYVFKTYNTSTLRNDTANLTMEAGSLIDACSDIVAFPLEVSMLPRALTNLRSKKSVFVLWNMYVIYVILHYLSKRVTDLRSTLISFQENYRGFLSSGLTDFQFLKGSGKTTTKKKKKKDSVRKKKSSS